MEGPLHVDWLAVQDALIATKLASRRAADEAVGLLEGEVSMLGADRDAATIAVLNVHRVLAALIPARVHTEPRLKVLAEVAVLVVFAVSGHELDRAFRPKVKDQLDQWQDVEVLALLCRAQKPREHDVRLRTCRGHQRPPQTAVIAMPAVVDRELAVQQLALGLGLGLGLLACRGDEHAVDCAEPSEIGIADELAQVSERQRFS
jgi:hypothetical protein